MLALAKSGVVNCWAWAAEIASPENSRKRQSNGVFTMRMPETVPMKDARRNHQSQARSSVSSSGFPMPRTISMALALGRAIHLPNRKRASAQA